MSRLLGYFSSTRVGLAFVPSLPLSLGLCFTNRLEGHYKILIDSMTLLPWTTAFRYSYHFEIKLDGGHIRIRFSKTDKRDSTLQLKGVPVHLNYRIQLRF
uniref:Putative secreted protein n=1 Tax=Anopheles darlingi TaxID=43151 RepID=A0A2M4DPX2_ANODA